VDLSRRDTEWCFHQNKFCTENCKLHSSDSQHQCSIHRDKLTRKHVRLCLDKEIHCKSGTESIGLLNKLCRLCRRLDTEELELETCIDWDCSLKCISMIEARSTAAGCKRDIQSCLRQSKSCKSCHKQCKYESNYFHMFHLDTPPSIKML